MNTVSGFFRSDIPCHRISHSTPSGLKNSHREAVRYGDRGGPSLETQIPTHRAERCLYLRVFKNNDCRWTKGILEVLLYCLQCVIICSIYILSLKARMNNSTSLIVCYKWSFQNMVTASSKNYSALFTYRTA